MKEAERWKKEAKEGRKEGQQKKRNKTYGSKLETRKVHVEFKLKREERQETDIKDYWS